MAYIEANPLEFIGSDEFEIILEQELTGFIHDIERGSKKR
jgi:hypothetical protein